MADGVVDDARASDGGRVARAARHWGSDSEDDALECPGPVQRGFAHLVRSLDRIEAASSVPSSDANRDFGYVPLLPPTVLAASGAPCDAGAAQPDAETPHIEESLPTLQDDAEVWLAALALLRFGNSVHGLLRCERFSHDQRFLACHLSPFTSLLMRRSLPALSRLALISSMSNVVALRAVLQVIQLCTRHPPNPITVESTWF